MEVVTIVRVVAVVAAGLLAGIFVGYRAGVHYAIPELSPSTFVQLQQIIHVHYVRFMPPPRPHCAAIERVVARDD